MFDNLGYSTGIRSSILDPNRMSCFWKRLYLCRVYFRTCCQKNKSKRYRLFQKAREKLHHETDAVSVIQNLKVINKIIEMKVKLNRIEVQQLERAKFTSIFLSSDEDIMEAKPSIKIPDSNKPFRDQLNVSKTLSIDESPLPTPRKLNDTYQRVGEIDTKLLTV